MCASQLWHSTHEQSALHMVLALKHSQYSLRHFDREQLQPFLLLLDEDLDGVFLRKGERAQIQRTNAHHGCQRMRSHLEILALGLRPLK
jgi:hypothetical protein